MGRVMLVGDCWDLKCWYIGNSKSHCDCQTMKEFEPGLGDSSFDLIFFFLCVIICEYNINIICN